MVSGDFRRYPEDHEKHLKKVRLSSLDLKFPPAGSVEFPKELCFGAALLPCCSTAELIEYNFKTGSLNDAFANSELSLALNLQAEESSSQKSGLKFLLWFLFLTSYQTSSWPWLQF